MTNIAFYKGYKLATLDSNDGLYVWDNENSKWELLVDIYDFSVSGVLDKTGKVRKYAAENFPILDYEFTPSWDEYEPGTYDMSMACGCAYQNYFFKLGRKYLTFYSPCEGYPTHKHELNPRVLKELWEIKKQFDPSDVRRTFYAMGVIASCYDVEEDPYDWR